jgi:hypothetical protein
MSKDYGIIEKNGNISLEKRYDGFHTYYAVVTGNKEYIPERPWSIESARSLYRRMKTKKTE